MESGGTVDEVGHLLQVWGKMTNRSVSGFLKMVGFPNNHGVFPLKMMILGCEMGVSPFKETP